MESKKCTKCSITKLLVDFNKRTDRVGAYESHCKKCRSEYRREKYLADPEKYKARWRASAQKKRCNPNFHIARQKYLQENKQAIAIQKAVYRSLNRGRFRQWAQDDRDALKDSYIKSLLSKKFNRAKMFEFITVCSACLSVKPYFDFGVDKGNKTGLTHKCKECTHEYRNKNWQANREKRLADKSLLRSNYSDSYIRELFNKRRKCKSSHIPKELIALYRENLRITRFIKEQGIQA